MKLIISTFSFLLLISVTVMAQTPAHALNVGDAIPKFSLLDQDGKLFNIADEIGKHVLVIYFYPKDESVVCTKEACSFRDSYTDFTKVGAKVIAINSFTVESHKNFQKNHQLPFTLLSDPGNKVYKQFGVKNKLFMTGRQTFVIDLQGKIAFTYEAMLEGSAHADKALAVAKSLKK